MASWTSYAGTGLKSPPLGTYTEGAPQPPDFWSRAYQRRINAHWLVSPRCSNAWAIGQGLPLARNYCFYCGKGL